ncbi:MAG: PD-(D/E)XK nuclease family protein [Marinilabiliaceae bacterium]|nr:PD-(D/E)XK nuclease family protein [Marinilabiliaceae bacterium]
MHKLKLIFSHEFVNPVYKHSKNHINVKFVGEIQLLSLLERELGMSGIFKSNRERENEYLRALKELVQVGETFISKSFAEDEIGVSKELLMWRDQLKLANWDFKTQISERLDLLAEVERKEEVSPGTADRWRRVINTLKKGISLSIGEIEICDNLDIMHPFYRELFNALKNCNVVISSRATVKYSVNGNLGRLQKALRTSQKDVEFDAADKSFQIIQFADDQIAADFLAGQLKNNFDPVIINQDNMVLNASMSSYGLPLAESSINRSNPQVLQLFKLLPELLYKPFRPDNLLALFNLPVSPIPGKLAKALGRVLANTNGIENEAWYNAINAFVSSFEDETEEKKSKRIIDRYLSFQRDKVITSKDISDLYGHVASWVLSVLNVEDYYKGDPKVLYHLRAMCTDLMDTLDNLNKEYLSLPELDRILSKVYTSVSLDTQYKEVKSCMVIAEPGQLYDQAKDLVWFDFHSRNLQATYCNFLFQSEYNKLEEFDGICLWTKEHQVQYQLQQLYKGFLNVNERLFLFIPDMVSGNETTAHPLMATLKATVSNIEEFVYEFELGTGDVRETGLSDYELNEVVQKKLPEAVHEINIENASLLQKRQTESYSSINNLIHYPFDWVMDYQARLSEKGMLGIGEAMTLKGNLSHMIVQELLQKHKKKELDFFEADIEKEIDGLLIQYTTKYAALFLLDEHLFEYNMFVNQLKQSVTNFREIIHENNLNFHSDEYEVQGNIKGVDFSGRIDLLFYKDETPVIIDLKWTYSSKKYNRMLEEEKAIQLALYNQLMSANGMTAYFLLSHGVLFTVNPSLKGKNVTTVKVGDPYSMDATIVQRMMNAYEYRWNEFKKGEIEEAEGEELSVINFAVDTEAMDLIPLDEDNRCKKVNPYSGYGLFKGDVK